MIYRQLCNSQPECARRSSQSGPNCSYWNISQCPEISFSTHALEEMVNEISNNICSNKIHTQIRTSPKSEWENKTVLLDLVPTVHQFHYLSHYFNYSTNNTSSVHQLHNPTYDTQPLAVVTHSRAVSVLKICMSAPHIAWYNIVKETKFYKV